MTAKISLLTILFVMIGGITTSLTHAPANDAIANQTSIIPSEPPRLGPLTKKQLKRKKEVEALMLKGDYLHDGSIELQTIGDIESIPALLTVLKKEPMSPDGMMICTRAHALTALVKITGQTNLGSTTEVWERWWAEHGSNKSRIN